MRGVMMYGPGDVRVEERDEPRVVEETDAIIRVSAACVCGSDLWPYRGIGADGVEWPAPMATSTQGSSRRSVRRSRRSSRASSSWARSGLGQHL